MFLTRENIHRKDPNISTLDLWWWNHTQQSVSKRRTACVITYRWSDQQQQQRQQQHRLSRKQGVAWWRSGLGIHGNRSWGQRRWYRAGTPGRRRLRRPMSRRSERGTPAPSERLRPRTAYPEWSAHPEEGQGSQELFKIKTARWGQEAGMLMLTGDFSLMELKKNFQNWKVDKRKLHSQQLRNIFMIMGTACRGRVQLQLWMLYG